ncbi:MAG: hypothetical protein KC505_02120 [Myxococcales bacterium]|nr:hypothetical protein [Myxococcales bacterium]USN50322.1 MAG: hypothetical protein H6731_08655 [Myxococcales bacterium]
MHELFWQCTGISFIDSTSVAVCHNKRIARNKVFKEYTARGKTSMGWFFGFRGCKKNQFGNSGSINVAVTKV